MVFSACLAQCFQILSSNKPPNRGGGGEAGESGHLEDLGSELSEQSADPPPPITSFIAGPSCCLNCEVCLCPIFPSTRTSGWPPFRHYCRVSSASLTCDCSLFLGPQSSSVQTSLSVLWRQLLAIIFHNLGHCDGHFFQCYSATEKSGTPYFLGPPARHHRAACTLQDDFCGHGLVFLAGVEVMVSYLSLCLASHQLLHSFSFQITISFLA